MKLISTIAAAALALSPLAANAGGLAAAVEEPMMMDDMTMADNGSINGSTLIPLLLLAFIAIAAGADEAEEL